MSHRKKMGRTGDFTPALWNWCILDSDLSECNRIMNTPLARAFALLSSATSWQKLGYEHPFGDTFHGLTNYVPMRYGKDTTMKAIEEVPREILENFYMMGDAEAMIKKLEKYCSQGLRHIILWNATGMFDLSKTKASYGVMKEILSYVKG
jgi:phthiodiolone/phenolphthiodiolone dimycocerosates ketoreductase